MKKWSQKQLRIISQKPFVGMMIMNNVETSVDVDSNSEDITLNATGVSHILNSDTQTQFYDVAYQSLREWNLFNIAYNIQQALQHTIMCNKYCCTFQYVLYRISIIETSRHTLNNGIY
ncbi:Hypothetical_protein [Hexamita inflata]|uniref:Hypothetical_protein n=1 Tax=Hexamita inflata TaxID=28002 RepID=A0AA86QTF4_9EUKA|nr:Hypothetical protein HINF_LOCUS53344 [Hexamita inflata]